MEKSYPPQWLNEGESPFCVPVFDCRSRALSAIPLGNDPCRKALPGKQEMDTFSGTLPPRPVKINLDYQFQLLKGPLREGILFASPCADERWFIFRQSDLIYFIFEEELTYLGHLRTCQETLRIDAMVLDRERIDSRDPYWDARVLYFLVRSHLFDEVAPHPLPAYLPDRKEEILMFSYHHFGSRGMFGAYRYR